MWKPGNAFGQRIDDDKRRGGQDWSDYSIESLDTATVSNSEKPRTQLSFTLVKTDADA